MKSWLKKHLVRGPLGLEETDGVLIDGQYHTHVASVKVLAPPDPEKNNPEIYGEVSFDVVGHSNSLITLFSRESDEPDVIDLAGKDNYLTLSDDHPRVLPEVSPDNPLHVKMKLYEKEEGSDEDVMIADIDHCESGNGVDIGYCFVLEGEKGFKFEVCYSVVLGALVEVEAEITKVGEGDRTMSCQVLAYQCLGESGFPRHPGQTRSSLKILYYNDPLILEVGKRIDLDRRFVVAPMWKDGYLRIRITPSIDEDDGFSERHDLRFPLVAFYDHFKYTSSFLTNNEMTHTKRINLSSGTEISVSIKFVAPEQNEQTKERTEACWKKHLVSAGFEGSEFELIDGQYQTHIAAVKVLAPPNPEKNDPDPDPDCKIYGEVSFDVVGHPESLVTLFSRERDNPDQIDLADDDKSYLTLSDHHQSPRVLPRVSRNNPLHVTMKLYETKEGSDEEVMIADIDQYESGNGVDIGYCFVLEGEKGFKFEVCYSVVLGVLVEVDAQISKVFGEEDGTLSCKVLAYQCLGEEGDPLFPSRPARTCSSLKTIRYDKPLPLKVGTFLDLERRFVVAPAWENGYLRIVIHDDDDDEFSEPHDLRFSLAGFYNFFKGTLSFLNNKEMTYTERIKISSWTEISVFIKFVRPVIS